VGQLSHAVCHYHPPNSLVEFGGVLFLPPTVLSYGYTGSFASSLVTYLITLIASITAYRLSPFHPLAGYPGPRLARISRFWATYQVLRGRQHLFSHALFERYGNAVRTGPDHLIIRDAAAVPVVLGSRNPWLRHECMSRLASVRWRCIDVVARVYYGAPVWEHGQPPHTTRPHRTRQAAAVVGSCVYAGRDHNVRATASGTRAHTPVTARRAWASQSTSRSGSASQRSTS
jgi:hypothetical protein